MQEFSGIQSSPETIPSFPAQVALEDRTHLELVTVPTLRRKSMSRFAIATALSLIPASCMATTYAKNEWLQTMYDDSGEMVPDVEDCEPFTRPRPVIIQSSGEPSIDLTATLQLVKSIAVEDTYKNTTSAAKNLNPRAVNPIKTAAEWGTILLHEQQNFTSSYSGLDIHLYSDRENAFKSFDSAVFDKLVHTIFDPAVRYDHIAMQELVNCMYQRFIDPDGPRELEGKRVNFFIPSEHGTCWVNGQFQQKPAFVKALDFCDSTGGTIYEFTFALGPIEHKTSWVVAMTTSHHKNVAERLISKATAHESIHLFTQAGGVRFELNDNERLVDAYEKESLKEAYPKQIPSAISYHDMRTSEKLISYFLAKI